MCDQLNYYLFRSLNLHTVECIGIWSARLEVRGIFQHFDKECCDMGPGYPLKQWKTTSTKYHQIKIMKTWAYKNALADQGEAYIYHTSLVTHFFCCVPPFFRDPGSAPGKMYTFNIDFVYIKVYNIRRCQIISSHKMYTRSFCATCWIVMLSC